MNARRILARKTGISLVAAGILFAPVPGRAERPEKIPAPAQPVVVENTDPIPVEGTVDATINGTVPVLVENVAPIPVEGTVVVGNADPIPVEGDVNAVVTGIVEVEDFSAQLEDLKLKVDQVRESVDNLDILTWNGFPEAFRATIGAGGTLTEEFLYEDVSFISISPENDRILVKMFDRNCDGRTVLIFGSKGQTFPAVHSVNFPDRVDFGCFKIECHNTIENCEVAINIVRRSPVT